MRRKVTSKMRFRVGLLPMFLTSTMIASMAFVAPINRSSDCRTGASRLPLKAASDSIDLASELAAMATKKSRRDVPSPPPSATVSDSKFLATGEELKGTVKSIKATGMVISLPNKGLNGFVHVKNIREGYINHPSDVHDIGDQVNVTVLRHTDDFLELTMKRMGNKDPMSFLVGQEVEGVVRGTADVGVYVNIGAKKDAFLFRGNIKAASDGGNLIRDAREYLRAGDKIKAWIHSKDEAAGKVELTMIPMSKVTLPIQRGLRLRDLQVGQEMGGVITGVRDFGCFVKIGAEADGFLHVRNINNGVVSNIRKLMRIGDSLVVKVLNIQGDKLELELVSIPQRLPAVDIFKTFSEEDWLVGTVSGKAPFGIFVDVDTPDFTEVVTGLLGQSHVLPDTNVTVGDDIRVRILNVNVAKKQLLLTQKEVKSMTD